MRRRWWVVLGAVLLLALIGTGIGVGVAAAHYQPLEMGGLMGGIRDARRSLPDPPEPGAPDVLDLAYRDGRELAWGFTLRNSGGWGVRVTSLDLPPAYFHAMARPVHVRMEPRNGPHGGIQGPGDEGTVPFQPFDLGPGEDRWILLDLRLGDCEFFPPGQTQELTGQMVHFSFLGMDHTAEIDFSSVLRVTAPAAQDCPRPSQVPHAG